MERLHADLIPAALGLEEASKAEGMVDYCRNIERIRAPRDLFEADLREVLLTGANLRCALMEGTDLRGARMERADLRSARMEGADLRDARMEGAVLRYASMEGAKLINARLKKADLRDARMEGAVLLYASMEGAWLRDARLKGADLSAARMEGANLSSARMEGADLRYARMEGADLRSARMEGADLSNARMEGADLSEADLRSTNLRAAKFANAALRSVDLTSSLNAVPEQLMKSFGDGSVTLTCAADAPPPCTNLDRPAHWPTQHLSYTAFYRRWNGWRLSHGLPAVPRGLPDPEDPKGAIEHPAIRPEDEAFYNPAQWEVCGEGGTASFSSLWECD